MLRIILAAALLVLPLVAQATLLVPSQYPTIQAAINAAQNGDTVLVAPGTYQEHVNFLGKSISLVSQQGPTVTAIHGTSAGYVVDFGDPGGASTGAMLSGFDIEPVFWGFGVRCNNGVVVTIDNCSFLSDPSGAAFTAITIDNASATVTNCTISGTAGMPQGSGIDCSGGSLTLSGCTVTGTIGGFGGPAIWGHDGASVSITECQVIGNSGGGILASDPLTALSVCNTTVASNTGGGIHSTSQCAPAIVANCIVTNNGHGLFMGSGGVVTNCTLSSNSGSETISAASPLSVYNSILWGNSGPAFAGSLGSITVDNSDVEGGWTGSGSANINLDPQFVGGGDYHLTLASPCIDSGLNTAPNIPATDIDGDPRIIGAAVDMGADEHTAPPPPSPLAGTGEDFALLTLVNGAGVPVAAPKTANGGDLLTTTMLTPQGTFLGSPVALVCQIFPNVGPPPVGVPSLFVHVDPNLMLVLFDGNSVIGTMPLTTSGLTLSFQLVPALTLDTVRLQAAAISPLANNGFFATSDAHDIVVQ